MTISALYVHKFMFRKIRLSKCFPLNLFNVSDIISPALEKILSDTDVNGTGKFFFVPLHICASLVVGLFQSSYG